MADRSGDPPERVPGTAFGEAPLPARPFDRGMGLAVARRTLFRPEDAEDFGRVADRVAEGNMALLGHPPTAAEQAERARLRNAIATGALLTSGRHLQHGDATQPRRPMEVFVNCATAIASFTCFYLLLHGAGVGRAYDDELVALDWAEAPELRFRLSPAHPDYPRGPAELRQFAAEFGLLPAPAALDAAAEERLWRELAALTGADAAPPPPDAVLHEVEDSREGWAKAVELLEAMTFRRERHRTLVLDLSAIRPRGAPIRGMQGRPAPGPLSLLRGLWNLRRHVIAPARARDPAGEALQPWEQALLADHYLSVEVQGGGARRAARMATKSWRDPGALRFVRLKAQGGLWTANHSLMVDREFWERVRDGQARRGLDDPWTRHALTLFEEATRCAWINGEPGFLNADLLEDHRTGFARARPVREDGGDVRSARYRADAAVGLLAELSRRASRARFPVTTNPCGEVVLHVMGGYCVVADFAPLLACPVPFEQVTPGAPDPDTAALWDARVEDAVRLGVRFLIRVNRMDALYAEEVRRTNRIGIGPTGLHEWAWLRFGLGFRDLLDETGRGAPFWAMLARLSAAAKQEALAYAESLGMAPPVTVTTVKPAGTTSKLFGLSEGAHLPARRQYLRWVQFRGTRGPDGRWAPGSDPLLAEYEQRGYPVRALRDAPGMSIVGFPTLPMAVRLGMGARLVTATEASAEEQYRWIGLLERHWIGEERGNQVSYTMKLRTDGGLDLAGFRRILLRHQPHVRACTVLPVRPEDATLGYEYLPEEEVDEERFAALLARIRDPGLHEAVDMAQLRCAEGICPT
ncbi:recombinase [Caldovatus aquaticus]|uniref:Recombinase n=1 Tax=Caldovatus aquaticus TaxID=2865671 RepID=A0ABS7EX52_9PROT|nr:recombinase [Caldovatus aquaticus]MBW8267939.1 recombinase [Caldovatus aquaticus]